MPATDKREKKKLEGGKKKKLIELKKKFRPLFASMKPHANSGRPEM